MFIIYTQEYIYIYINIYQVCVAIQSFWSCQGAGPGGRGGGRGSGASPKAPPGKRPKGGKKDCILLYKQEGLQLHL